MYFCIFRHTIVKVDAFFEQTAQSMTPRIFRRYFRMYSQTLGNLIRFFGNDPNLQPLRANTSITVGKKIAMTCAYLGSTTPYFSTFL